MISLFQYVATLKQTITNLDALDIRCTEIAVSSTDYDVFSLELFFLDGQEFVTIDLEYTLEDLAENDEQGLTQQIIEDIIYAVSLEQLNYKTLH